MLKKVKYAARYWFWIVPRYLQTFLNDHVAPYYEQWEHDGLIPRHIWNLLGENGFLCVDVPEEYGGYGAPVHYSLMLVQETARAGFGSLAVAIGGQNELVSPYIQNMGSEAQKKYWLPKMVSGEVVTAIAMTEANAGSDLQAIRTQAILKTSITSLMVQKPLSPTDYMPI